MRPILGGPFRIAAILPRVRRAARRERDLAAFAGMVPGVGRTSLFTRFASPAASAST